VARANPDLLFTGLQGSQSYRLDVAAYKLGTVYASTSVNLNTTNDTTPGAVTVALSVPYSVSTLAGSGVAGYADGQGVAAQVNRPFCVLPDPYGNLFIADHDNHAIRKVSPTGLVSTFAGSTAWGMADGTGTIAQFNYPFGLAFDSAGVLYVAEECSHRIRKITPGGVSSTIAGNGSAGLKDGSGTQACFNQPIGISLGSQGNLYIADYGNHCIRKITPGGVVSTIAGSGSSGYLDGTGTQAVFFSALDLTVDNLGYVYVSDWQNNRIRRITPDGVVTTIGGNGPSQLKDGTGLQTSFNRPWGIALDAQGNLYIGDECNNVLRKMQ
jgi:sugar lactone lactonase YvrE